MNSQSIPPPPQYPNYSTVDFNETGNSKEDSVMENSVVYISDTGSPSYKSPNRNEIYVSQTNQILPNLVSSINNTYQNLPPKSPKSNYRHIVSNNIDGNQKANIMQFKPFPNNTECNVQNDFSQQFRPFQNVNFNKQPTYQQWLMKPPKEEAEDRVDMHQPIMPPTVSAKTRSHPNLMNDYVNLSGADSVLNEIHFNRPLRSYFQPTNDLSKGYMYKPHPMTQEQFSPILGPTPSSPELARNGIQMYSSQGFPDPFNRNNELTDHFSSESSRLVNLLLEENKRLRTKLRQSDTRLESVDQLERKIHNLELLFEELLTSQRRQRLLDLQLQQASLTNYLAKNTSSNEILGTTCSYADPRKPSSNPGQPIIPSSSATENKEITESPGENSVASSKQKNDMSKRQCHDNDRFIIENDGSDQWIDQTHMSPVTENGLNIPCDQSNKLVEEDVAVKFKQNVKCVNIVPSGAYHRSLENNPVSLINSPTELLGRRLVMSPGPTVSRNWLAHHTSTPPSYRVRLSQHPTCLNVNGQRVSNASKATSAMNLTGS